MGRPTTTTPETTTTATTTKTVIRGKNVRMSGQGVDKSGRASGVKVTDSTVATAASGINDPVDNSNERGIPIDQLHSDIVDDGRVLSMMSKDAVVASDSYENSLSSTNGEALYARPMGKRVSVQPKISPDRLVHHRNGNTTHHTTPLV